MSIEAPAYVLFFANVSLLYVIYVVKYCVGMMSFRCIEPINVIM